MRLLLLGAFIFVNITFANINVQKEFDKKYLTSSLSKKLFMKQISGLNYHEQDKFMLGFSFYRIPWVEAPAATTARDGLGPLFSSNSCISCHPNNAQGSVFNNKGQVSRSYVVRLSIPNNGSKEHEDYIKFKGFVPEPTYGEQISINGTVSVPFEAKPLVRYETKTVIYPDGEKVELSRPLKGSENNLVNLNYGSLHPNVNISKRIAPALVGLGLLELISDEQILANEDINDFNHDGISGKANRVYNPKTKKTEIGRYTWKASASSVIHQSAAAASSDMGLTSSLFPEENCTTFQKECLKAPKADDVRGLSPLDLPDLRLEAIAFYLTNLKIPKSEVKEVKGEKLFQEIGCVKCHTPKFTLENGYVIKPFSDMLLHDMGDDLSDGRSEFLANKNEFRTAPLWSIGKRIIALGKAPDLLHDGRAKTIEEAILWHGGEAYNSKKIFMQLPKTDREDIIRYIKEL